jgi:hypothetical protein
MLIFLLMFSLFFSLFEFLYFIIPDAFLSGVIYHHGLVLPSAAIIQFLHPTEQVIAAHNILSSRGFSLEVVRGCDGAGIIFLLTAAILAFPASVKNKIFGIVTVSSLFIILNFIRIVGLYFVMSYKSQWFAPLHTYFIPTFIIILGCLFFAVWVQMASSKK